MSSPDFKRTPSAWFGRESAVSSARISKALVELEDPFE